MDVIIANMPGMNGEVFPSADHLEDSLEFLFDIPICQHLASVLGSPDKMVLAGICAMALRLI